MKETTHHLDDSPSRRLPITTTHHFDDLPSRRLTITTTSHQDDSPFRRLTITTTHHYDDLPSRRLTIWTTYHQDESPFRRPSITKERLCHCLDMKDGHDFPIRRLRITSKVMGILLHTTTKAKSLSMVMSHNHLIL